MGAATDFITSFHSLEGDLIGERKKNFYKLITRPSLFSNEQELNDALQNLKPKTYQESLFHVDALIYFKRTEQLKDIMKSGNQLFATKILKQPWFFQEAFKDIEGQVFVNEFLPHLSYVVRKKLLNRISKYWDEEKIDKLFDALENRYGIREAAEILDKCSPGKIQSILENNEIKLRPNQVIQLYKKGHEVIKIYLKHINQITKSKYQEEKVINYIALKEPKLLLELEKNKIVSVHKIGRRTTKGLLKASKDEISTDVKRYSDFLNKPTLVRNFSPDFKSIYKQIFPDKFSELTWYTCQIIQFYPKKRRWDLFLKTCTDKFPNKKLTDCLTSLDDSIVNFQPPKEIIHQWAEIHYEMQENDPEKYLKYYPVAKAIKMIKEKIEVTSDKRKRQELIRYLLQACGQNKDLDMLEEVLKYISVRHRNEDANCRKDVLTTVQNCFELTELNETHWKYLHEHLQILKIQKEFGFYNFHEIIYKYFEYLFKNKKDYKPVLEYYLQDMIEDSFYQNINLKNPVIEKEIYSEICKIFPDFTKKDPQHSQYVSNLLSKIIGFSIDQKDHCIELKNYPYFVEEIMENLKKNPQIKYHEKENIQKVIIYNETFPQYAVPIEDSQIIESFVYITNEVEKSIWWFRDALLKLIETKNRSELGNKILKTYLEELLPYSEYNIISWLLKNDPNTLVPYFEKILERSIAEAGFSLEEDLLRQYSHLDFDRKTREYYKKHLKVIDEKETDVIKRMLESLIYLLPTEEFIMLVEEKYLPKKDKLDLQDEEMRRLYKIQCDLARFLARVPEPYKMLPTIMKFCRGDFLQVSLAALYSAFYNSPQRILYSYVEQLSKQAISARKHAIFLSCAVLDKEHAINLLIKTSNQGNVSSQKHLFSATLKYFIKNPSQDLLEKVIENMNTIDKNDTETLDSLKDVSIPEKYRHTYIEKCWNFFENLKSTGVKVQDYLEKLLDYMCEDILVSLSKEFIAYVVERYFPIQNKDERLTRVDHFVLEVLKKRKSERRENFNLIFQLLLKFKSYWLNHFFNSFLQVAREKDTDNDFIQLFSDHWNKNFTIIQTLENHIALKLLLIKTENSLIEKYALGVVNYMDQLINELGYLVTSVFRTQLIDALNSLEEPKNKLRFHLAVLKQKLDSNTCVLVIQCLDEVDEDDDDEDEEIKEIYKEIKSILQNVDEPIVKAYYKSMLANNNN